MIIQAHLSQKTNVRLVDQPCNLILDIEIVITELDVELKLVGAASMKPGAKLITSGIIDFKEQEVADALIAAGLQVVESNAQGEWRNITACK